MQLRSGNMYFPPKPVYNTQPPPQYLRDIPPPEVAYPIDVGQSRLPIAAYDGTGSIVDFIERFELLADAKEWDADAMVRWFPLFLSSTAALFYRGLRAQVKRDWPQLKQALTDEFNNNDARNLQITKLNKIRQGASESVVQFASRIQQMAASAYEGMGACQVQPLLLAHFQQGLRPEIKRHVLVSAPADFADACRMAKTIENNIYLYEASPDDRRGNSEQQ